MATITVYQNNNASKGTTLKWRNEIRRQLFRHDIEFRFPETIDDLYKGIDRDIKELKDYIFSIGGDGTAHTIVQKIAGTNIKLLVVPSGTANDLATELDIDRSVKTIVKMFKQNNTSTVDLIKINEKLMFSNGGIGLASEVAAQVNQLRSKFKGFKQLMKYSGFYIYPLTLALNLLTQSYKRYKVVIKSPDSPFLGHTLESPLLMINNQSFIGGFLTLTPESNNNDGKFEVCVFLHPDKTSFIKCAANIILGKIPEDDKYFVTFSTDELEIISSDETSLNFFGDGEQMLSSSHLKLKIMPQALNVVRPNKNHTEESYSLILVEQLS